MPTLLALFFPDCAGSACPSAHYPYIGVSGREVYGILGWRSFFGKCFIRKLWQFKFIDSSCKNTDRVIDPTQRAAPQTTVLTKNEVVANEQRISSSRKGWITGISVKPTLTQKNTTVTVSVE